MEIERKWMVKGWPEGLPLREEFAMRQGYISVRPTVRIREEALTGGRTDYILCFKSGGGLAREEIQRSIDKALFEDLEHKIIGKPLIPKTRRTYRLPDGSALEVNHVDAGREAILKVHAKKIKASDDVDLHTIARMASGASGAELANIINEAALRAVRSGRTVVNESDLEESIEVVIAGYQKKNAVLSDQEKKVVAYHEIGHALVAALQSHSAPVQKITIIPRTSGALGYTMQVEQGDKYLMTKKELENKIATFTGGRAAEEIVFGEITTGASNDIEQATKIAKAMITRYGMTDEFDMVAMENVTNQYLGGDTSLSCSADTQKEIDEKVVQLVKAGHEKARKILAENREKLDELAMYLYEKETITGDEFMDILDRK